MKKSILAVLPIAATVLLSANAEASSHYYWHNGGMDDSTVLNKDFKAAIKVNHFTYDGVNINTSYNTFKNVMRGNYSYKKVGTGKYKSANSTFIFSLNNGKVTSSSKLKGIYFDFNDYSITSSTFKKVYGTPAAVKSISGGKTYIYNGTNGITNKFDFVKVNGSYRLSGFITSK